MKTEQTWFGVKDYNEATKTPHSEIQSSSCEKIALWWAWYSCEQGNFKKPYGKLGYWFEYDVENPTIPWFRFKGQGFEPWEKDRGEWKPEDIAAAFGA